MTKFPLKPDLVSCGECGWPMRFEKLLAHTRFRHPAAYRRALNRRHPDFEKNYNRIHGARNSRSPAVSHKTSPPRPVKAIKAAAIPGSLQTHSGWKQAKTEESQDVTGS